MKKILSLLLLFFFLTTTAQVPEPHMLSMKVIGGTGGDQVSSYTTETPDGGFIISIGTSSLTGPITDTFCAAVPSNGKAIFMKYNADGTVREWFKCRQNSWSDTGYGFMIQTVDDKYILAGSMSSGNRWIIRKEDAAGNVLWTKTYGGSGSQMLYSMTATDDGGYVLFGSAYGGDGDIGFHYGSPFTRDFWVLKVDANGNKVWSKVYGGTAEVIGASILAVPGGGYYIIGSSNSSDYECTGNHGSGDVFIARLDAGGDMLWHHSFGGSGSDGGEIEGCSAILDGSGGVLIAAKTSSADGDVSHKINNPGDNFWLLDVNDAGAILWDDCYGGGGAEIPSSICKATDGGIWIIGQSHYAGGQVNLTYGGSSDGWVVHTDGVGNFLNAKVLGSSGQDVGQMIHQLSDGMIIAGGYYMQGNGTFPTEFQGGSIDAFLTKFSNWPNEIPAFSLNTSVSVYPNPARETVRIEHAINKQLSIVINDVTGRTVHESTAAGNAQIAVGNWQAGMYYVQVIGDDGYKEVQKLMVQ